MQLQETPASKLLECCECAAAADREVVKDILDMLLREERYRDDLRERLIRFADRLRSANPKRQLDLVSLRSMI